MHEYIRPPQQPKPLDGVGSVMHCKWELPALSGCTLHVRNHCNVCPRPMPLVDEQMGNGLNSTDIRIKTAVKKNPHDCQTNALLSTTATDNPKPLTATGRVAKLRNSIRTCAVRCYVSPRRCNSHNASAAVLYGTTSRVFANRPRMLVSRR